MRDAPGCPCKTEFEDIASCWFRLEATGTDWLGMLLLRVAPATDDAADEQTNNNSTRGGGGASRCKERSEPVQRKDRPLQCVRLMLSMSVCLCVRQRAPQRPRTENTPLPAHIKPIWRDHPINRIQKGATGKNRTHAHSSLPMHSIK